MFLIFDWDGTLSNSTNKIVQCLGLAASDLKLPALEHHQYQNVIGLSLTKAVKSLYQNITDREATEFASRYIDHYIELDKTPCSLFDGVFESLETFKNKGFKLAVATGKSRKSLNRVLKNVGMESYFHATRCSDETASKPSPLMLEELIIEMQYAHDECLLIGDTEYDLEMATNAGIRSVGVSFGAHEKERLHKHNPIAVIDHFAELDSTIDKFLNSF